MTIERTYQQLVNLDSRILAALATQQRRKTQQSMELTRAIALAAMAGIIVSGGFLLAVIS